MSDKVTSHEFVQLICAALTGVCSSHETKFDCHSRLEIARTAISIARHVIDELEEQNETHNRESARQP